jgi:hypothetical protein
MYALIDERSIERFHIFFIGFHLLWFLSEPAFSSLNFVVTLAAMSTDSANIGWRLQLFTGFFTPLQVIAVALRFYSRWLVVGQSHPLEDALVVLALVTQLVLSAIGLGRWIFILNLNRGG